MMGTPSVDAAIITTPKEKVKFMEDMTNTEMGGSDNAFNISCLHYLVLWELVESREIMKPTFLTKMYLDSVHGYILKSSLRHHCLTIHDPMQVCLPYKDVVAVAQLS
jgi:hypothetical protein